MQVFIITWIQNGVRGISTWRASTMTEAIDQFRRYKPAAKILDIEA